MKDNKHKYKWLHWIRRSVQILTVLFFPAMFATIFYAIKSVYTALITQNFTWRTSFGSLAILAGVLLTTLIFGRVFCGFFCSFGAMQDLMWFLSNKTISLKWRIPQAWDQALKWIKYGILLFLVIVSWTFQYQLANQMVSPWTVFGIYTSLKGWSSPQYLISIGGLLLVLILVFSFFIERFFCRYLCPLGAVLALVARFRPYTLKKPTQNCGSCRVCTHFCSMGIPLKDMEKVRSGECISCFQCMEKCPRENISANPAPVAASAISVAAIAGLVYLGNLTSEERFVSQNQVSESQNTQKDMSEDREKETQGCYVDGTYTGTGTGFRGDTEVSVTVENGNITDITVVSYADDEQFFVQAENRIIQEILETQSVDVAAVSGATYSSNGIKEAVANAIGISFTNPNGDSFMNKHGHGKGDGHRGAYGHSFGQEAL